jgi:cellulose synthase/poly-beta-1,6-N-acetylglucosamine synthase-like glycosyltransferase
VKAKTGIRRSWDSIALFTVFGVALSIIVVLFVPLVMPPQGLLFDIGPLTYAICIFTTIIVLISAGYSVLSLIVPLPVHKGSTFHGKYSILIGAKNEGNVITSLIDDLLNQTYEDFEIIVVCHNCTDNTYEVVKNIKDPRVRAVELKGGQGKSVALNYGAQFVTGEIIAVFDADNNLPNNFLEMASHYFPRYDAIQSKIHTKNASFNLLTRLQDLEFVSFTGLFQVSRAILHKDALLGGTGEVIKADVAKKVGYWDEWAFSEDFAMTIKLIVNGYKIGWCSDTYVLDEKIPWWSDFLRQRARWTKGHWQVMYRYSAKFWRSPVDFHYLTAPLVILGTYFTMVIWFIFFLQIPLFTTAFLPIWVWLVPWIIYHLGIVLRIAKGKGVRSLKYYPFFFFYLFHYMIAFLYMFKVKSWPKTPHGFGKKEVTR